MAAGGFILVHRKMLESITMSDDWLCRLWMTCLLKANFKTGFFKGDEIPPGSFAFSYRLFSESLGVSKGKLRRGLSKLNQSGQITVKAGRDFSTVTICNWSTYQDWSKGSRDADGHADGTPMDTPMDTQTGHDRKKGMKVKNEKKGKKKESTTPDKLDEVPAAVDHSGCEIIFPTQGKSKEWILPADKMREWQDVYEFDVLPEILKARQWCRDNRTKRKTIKGMAAFLCRWLNRTADSGVRGSQKQTEFKSAGERREQGNIEAMKGFLNCGQADANDSATIRGHLD